jgi:hypothetical protein
MSIRFRLFSKAALIPAITVAALAVPNVAHADALVVRSTGPSAASYPVGRRLPATDRVVLRAGDRVVLVGEGATRTLSGPGNFPVRASAATPQRRTNTLGRYLSTSGSTISRTGAVRGSGADAPASAPNLWVVDVMRGGTFCVPDIANVTLWRGDMSEDTLLTVQGATAAARTSIAFVAGQNFRRWPSETMPLAPAIACPAPVWRLRSTSTLSPSPPR